MDFRESGRLNLQTGKVTDDRTGKSYDLADWSDHYDRRDTNYVESLIAKRDVTSDLLNLPGTKASFYGVGSGLIDEGRFLNGTSNKYSGLTGY